MKWQYKVHAQWCWTRHGQAKLIEDLCNQYGQEGWQLCDTRNGFVFGLLGFDLTFGRPVPETEQAAQDD